MKITSVELHPASSLAACVLSFRDPRRINPYNIKAIEGLGADEIVPRYYGGSGSSAKFYNLFLQKRDVVLSIELNPRLGQAESYSSLRDDLYKLISSSRTGLLEIQFKNGSDVVATISGFVKKFEPSHFEKNPDVKLTIDCPDPLLRAPVRTEIDISTLDPTLTVITDELSTAPHGFTSVMTVLNTMASFSVTDPNDDSWEFAVTPLSGFLPGDTLYFSSEFNNKYLYMLRGSSTIYLADVIVPGSVWPIIFPGENSFAFEDDTLLSWVSLEHYPTYWGV